MSDISISIFTKDCIEKLISSIETIYPTVPKDTVFSIIEDKCNKENRIGNSLSTL